MLEYGGKRDLVECLMGDDQEEMILDPSAWLVECTRDEAIAHLKDKHVGTFLIRTKDDPLKPYALSIV